MSGDGNEKMEERHIPPLQPTPFPNVCNLAKTLPSSPSSHTSPLPIGPNTPVACASSTTTYPVPLGNTSSTTSTIPRSGATSPSMLYTASTATKTCAFPCLNRSPRSCSDWDSSAVSWLRRERRQLCAKGIVEAARDNRMPSCTLAWMRAS